MSQGTQTETKHTVVQHVQQTLREDPQLAVIVPRVQIEAPSDDVVVLRGTVQSQEEKERIITKVRHMRGVQRVDDQLQIASVGSSAYSEDVGSSGPDTIIVRHVRETLREDPQLAVILPRVQIESPSEDVVILRGTVQSQEERQRIITKVREMKGVKRVDDQLQVTTTSSSSTRTGGMDSSSTRSSELSSSTDQMNKDKAMTEHEHAAAGSSKMQKSSKDATAKDTELSSSTDLKNKDKTMTEREHATAESAKAQKGDHEASAKSAEPSGNASMAATGQAGKTKEDRTGTGQEGDKASN
jgi:osmotically-inducible protein OsmY